MRQEQAKLPRQSATCQPGGHLKAILIATFGALACICARADSDEVLLAMMQRTVSLFECANLVETRAQRRPFLEAGTKSGREFLLALNADRKLYDRIWQKVDVVFFHDATTIDFQLGAAYASLAERVVKPFDYVKPLDEWTAARDRAFKDKNCALLIR